MSQWRPGCNPARALRPLRLSRKPWPIWHDASRARGIPIAARDHPAEQDTARVWIFVAGLAAWAGLTVATAALAALPVATLLPLLLLAGGLRGGLRPAHRRASGLAAISRCSTRTHPANANWEHTVMAFGRTFPGRRQRSAVRPLLLCSPLLPTSFPRRSRSPRVDEWAAIGAAHLVFLVRIAAGRRQSASQRAIDLERFEKLKRNGAADRHETATTRRAPRDGQDR